MSTHHSRSTFINDLVPLILECHDNWWPADYLRLALVSDAWLWPVRKRLYSFPRIRTFRACSLLARTLHENPELVRCKHGLDLRLESGTGDMSGVRSLLGLRGLKYLTLGGGLAMHAEIYLHMISHPQTITHLCIDGYMQSMGSSFFCGNLPSLEWDESLAFKLHNVRQLRLSNLELDVVTPPPAMPYQMSITNLELSNVSLAGGELLHLMNQCWTSLESFSVLATSEAEYDEHVKELLSVCKNLRSLRYEIKHPAGHPEPVFDDESEVFPSLRQVYLSGRLDPPFLAAVSRCCPEIETLSISGRPASVTPGQWLSFVKHGSPSTLKELNIPWYTYNPPFQFCWSSEQLQPILDACKSRGITLVEPHAHGRRLTIR